MSDVRPELPGLPDTVPARMLNEFVYCARLFYLEWVQSRFATSHDVEEGLYVHRVVDVASGELPVGDSESASWGGRRATSMWLTSPTLGVSAKVDVVESGSDGALVPVDYKKGHPDAGDLPWPSDRVQSVLQAMLLREHGYRCDRAEIWYDETRQRVAVDVTDSSVEEVTSLLRAAWQVAAADRAPRPLVNSPKCPRCSLVGICLPDETQTLVVRSSPTARPRRIVPDAGEARPVYVVEQGSVVGVRRGRIEIFGDGSVMASYRLIDVSQVCIYGNVSVTAQAMRELMARDAAVLYFSFGGWFSGMATGLPGKNVDLRRAQVMASPDQALDIARRMISAKIRNSRVLLRRNSRVDVAATVEQLGRAARGALAVQSAPSLLGVEGTAARLYFGRLTTMIGPAARVDTAGFDENGRARRPPPDPLNALLSFCYALLVKDLTATVHSVGFDPYLGVLHRPRFGRPALALDLAEEFRPLIAESVVLQVLNNGEIATHHFRQRAGGCQLEPEGRKAVLRAYERRLDQEVKHPHFGYQVSYRRALEVQCRVLAAHLLSELPEYTAFTTR